MGKQLQLKNNQRNDTITQTQEYPKWHNVVSGAAAGAGARLLTAPLDLLKIRRQLSSSSPSQIVSSAAANSAPPKSLPSISVLFKDPLSFVRNSYIVSNANQILNNEGGVRGLFRGNVAATYLWIGYAVVQFTLYSQTSSFFTNFHLQHTQQHQHHPQKVQTSTSSFGFQNLLSNIGSNPTATSFCAGATAGVAATIATYPFDICRTVFAAQGIQRSTASASTQAIASSSTKNIIPPKSLLDFASTMLKRNGAKGFFVGCGPAVIQIIPYMGINFALYDYMTRIGKDKKSNKVNPAWAGAAGLIAGGTSKVIVYPLDTVKKRLQAQTFMVTSSSTQHVLKYNGMYDCIVKIAKQEGAQSFYKGLVPTVIKSMAGTGFSFAFFTLTKNSLESIHDHFYPDEMKP